MVLTPWYTCVGGSEFAAAVILSEEVMVKVLNPPSKILIFLSTFENPELNLKFLPALISEDWDLEHIPWTLWVLVSCCKMKGLLNYQLKLFSASKCVVSVYTWTWRGPFVHTNSALLYGHVRLQKKSCVYMFLANLWLLRCLPFCGVVKSYGGFCGRDLGNHQTLRFTERNPVICPRSEGILVRVLQRSRQVGYKRVYYEELLTRL